MIAFILSLLTVNPVEQGKKMTYTVNQESVPRYVNKYEMFEVDISE